MNRGKRPNNYHTSHSCNFTNQSLTPTQQLKFGNEKLWSKILKLKPVKNQYFVVGNNCMAIFTGTPAHPVYFPIG